MVANDEVMSAISTVSLRLKFMTSENPAAIIINKTLAVNSIKI